MGMRNSKVLVGGTLIMEKKIDRYESMNKLKKNGGFSLVELIVVVLIMAIIATALTLAVTNYVARAKRSSDANTAGELKSAMEMAIMDGMTGASNAAYEIANGDIYLELVTDEDMTPSTGASSVLSDDDLELLSKLIKSTVGDGPIYSKVHPKEYFKVVVSRNVSGNIEIDVTITNHSSEHPLTDYTY